LEHCIEGLPDLAIEEQFMSTLKAHLAKGIHSTHLGDSFPL